MKHILKPVGYMTLVLLGGIAQIISEFSIKSFGIDYFDSTGITFLSFLGVIEISAFIFLIVLIANWRSSKSQPEESRNSAIKNLRSKLRYNEKEQQKSKIRISELEREQENLRQESNKANAQLQQEKDKFKARVAELERERENFKQASDKANAQLQLEKDKFEARVAELERERENFKQASKR